jgi:uncharacterized membrane protein YjjB (DUF3815 family)
MSSTKRLKGAFGLVGSVTAATGAVANLRRSREKNDRLLLANAIASILVAITGVLIAARTLKKGGDE